jgi:arylsulfatase A-like enzyme
MLAVGPGIRQNAVVNRPIDSLDLVPTLGALMGFSPTLAKGKPLPEVL